LNQGVGSTFGLKAERQAERVGPGCTFFSGSCLPTRMGNFNKINALQRYSGKYFFQAAYRNSRTPLTLAHSLEQERAAEFARALSTSIALWGYCLFRGFTYHPPSPQEGTFLPAGY
jgi:hypothetical protein